MGRRTRHNELFPAADGSTQTIVQRTGRRLGFMQIRGLRQRLPMKAYQGKERFLTYKSYYVRIYAVHDYDLMKYCLSLKANDQGRRIYRNSPASIMRQALRAYVREEAYLPPVVSRCVNILPRGSIRANIRLHNDKDADIIAFMERIRRRQKNSFLKNLLRRYIRDSCVMISYLEDMDVNEAASVRFPYAEKKKIQERKAAEVRESAREQPAFQPEPEPPVLTKPDVDPGAESKSDYDSDFDFFAALGQALEGR